jgi:general secretion pathway protein D
MAIRLLLMGLCLALTLCPGSAAATDPDTPAGEDRFVSIDFNNVDIAVFVKFISELTGRNFIVDERVRGKVTVISPSRISVAEAFKVFESVLEVHGFTTVPSGTVTKIVPAPEARGKSIETRLYEESGSATDRVVTQIAALRYADPEEVRKLLAPLVSKNSVLLAYPPTGMLILTDVQSNIQRLMRIITAIDVTGVGLEIAVIGLQYAEALKLEKIVAAIFNPPAAKAQKAPGSGADTVQVVSDERTNSLIVLAKESDLARLRDLIALLDRETPRGQGKIRVYYLENAVAEDLAKVLQDVPVKDDKKPASGAAAEAPALSGEIQITADQATNSLIIIAAKEDYEVIEEIIAKLDIPRIMVYIECLIMEVNVNKDFSLGVEWSAFGKTDIDGRTGGFGGGFGSPDPTRFLDLEATGAFGIFGETLTIGGVTFPSLGAVIDAYKHDKDVHILSTPQILTTDNQEAKIYIGKNVPFQTRQETTSTTNIDYSSYEYKDVGTTLKITPRINQQRLVRLDISQEVTKLESNVDFRPTTLKRTIDTSVIVQNGQTVVIGGLIDESTALTEKKVPVLGDIPLLGWLFKTRGRGNEKTNLFVFITPRVIRHPGEADEVYADKKAYLDRLEAGSPLRKHSPGEPETLPAVVLPPAADERIRLYPGPGSPAKTAP